MILDHEAKAGSLKIQQARLLYVHDTGFRTARRMIMRKEDLSRIEVEGPGKHLARRHQNVRGLSFSYNFFSNNKSICVSKDREHALLGQLPHRHQKIGEHCFAIFPQSRPHDLLAHAIVYEPTNHQEGVNPPLADLGSMTKLDI